MVGACSTYGEEDGCIQGFGGGNVWERDHVEDPGVDARIILRWNFKKWDGLAWTGLIWLRTGTGGGQL